MARALRTFYAFRLLATSYPFVPVAVAFASSRGLGLVEIMTLKSIYAAVVLASEVPTGALADRLGRRRAMMLGAATMVAACLLWAVAHGFAAFAAAEVLAALSMTLCSGADTAYLFDLLEGRGDVADYPRREGTATAWHLAGSTAAFAAGGLLGEVSLVLPYLVGAGVAACAFGCATRLEEPARRRRRSVRLRDEVAAAFRVAGSRPGLRWTIAYSALVFALLRSTEYVAQPYLAHQGLSVGQTGLVFAALYLVAAGVAHGAMRLRGAAGEPALLFGVLLVLAATFLGLGAATGVVSVVILFSQAVANGLYAPLVKPLLNREIDDSGRRATVLSVESMVRRGAFLAFAPVLGWVMARTSVATGFTLCGGVAVAGAVVLAVLRPRVQATVAAAPTAESDPVEQRNSA